MMNVERSKNKIKIEINKALQTVSGIVKPTAEIRQQLHQTYKDITPDKGEQIHSIPPIIEAPSKTPKPSKSSSLVTTTVTGRVRTIGRPTLGGTTQITGRMRVSCRPC